MLVILLLRLGPAAPDRADPVHQLAGGQGPVPVMLRGVLLEDPRRQGGAAQDPGCQVLLQTAGGRSELLFKRCPVLQQGWTVRVSGTLHRPQAAPHPLLAGPAERLARAGALTRLRVEQLQVLQRPATPILDLRRRIASRLIAAAGAERGGLLAALVLGSAVVPLPAELREAFRASGLSHALAASGFHLTVLLGVVTALSRPLARPLRLGLATGAAGGFLLLAGAQGSVVRAVLMAAVALLAREFDRRARPLPLLLVVVLIMLLIQPSWLLDVGLQLSVAATAGLLITAPPLERAIAARMPGGGDRKPGWARSWLAPALAVPLAATLWTLPLQLHHFGVVPLYAVPANLLAAPLLTPLTLGSMALALVSLVLPQLLAPLLLPVQPLAGLLLGIASWFAGLPQAQLMTGRPLPLLVSLLAIALLGLLLPRLAAWMRWLALLLLLGVSGVHLMLQRSDQLLLVQQPGGGSARTLLLARHAGRGALISSRADGLSCRQARRLATALGVETLDWLLLLDPVASEEPGCWQKLAGLVVAYGDGSVPLGAQEGIRSRGLHVQALTQDSHALRLQLGRQQWLLLPDRQALRAWRSLKQPCPEGVWLGFRPSRSERQALEHGRAALRWRWWSGPPAREGAPDLWQASGTSGSLQAWGG